jgi:hypothetical protein
MKSEFLVGISLIAAKSVKITVTYYVHRYNVSVGATGPVFSGPGNIGLLLRGSMSDLVHRYQRCSVTCCSQIR